MITETLAERLKRLRTAQDMKVADLAKASGLSKPYIWQMEDGKRKTPSGENLLKLASALGITVGELLGAEEGISAEDLESTPDALEELIETKGRTLGIRKEDLAMLRGIHYRGKRPDTAEDYELILLLLRRILG